MMSVSGNMVGQWCLVENAQDSSGNNIDGEAIRKTSSVDGNFGDALDKTGTVPKIALNFSFELFYGSLLRQ